jgi:RNA-binding protein YhbY
MKAKYGKLEEVTVTTEELVKILVGNGENEKDAKFQVGIATKLGANNMVIGNTRYIIKNEQQSDGSEKC